MATTTAPARTNRYAATCVRCDRKVAAEAGVLTRENGAWITRCADADLCCEIADLNLEAKVYGEVYNTDAPVAPARAEVSEGFYLVGTDTVYKVQESKSTGGLYAKVLVPGTRKGKPHGTFQYQAGAIGTVRRSGTRLTLEEAAALGHRFTFCVICGAYLENEESVARGIGPVCYGKVA